MTQNPNQITHLRTRRTRMRQRAMRWTMQLLKIAPWMPPRPRPSSNTYRPSPTRDHVSSQPPAPDPLKWEEILSHPRLFQPKPSADLQVRREKLLLHHRSKGSNLPKPANYPKSAEALSRRPRITRIHVPVF